MTEIERFVDRRRRDKTNRVDDDVCWFIKGQWLNKPSMVDSDQMTTRPKNQRFRGEENIDSAQLFVALCGDKIDSLTEPLSD